MKNWLIWKDPDAGKDWRLEEKGTTEDEMVGWCHRLNGPEFESAPGVGEGQGSLVCCSPWGRKESDMTEQLTELNWTDPMLSGNSGSSILNVFFLTGLPRAFNMLIYNEDCSFPNFFDHGCCCTITLINISLKNFTGLPSWLSVKRIHCQRSSPQFDPSVGKIPWRRKRQSTPILLSRKFHGQRNLERYI